MMLTVEQFEGLASQDSLSLYWTLKDAMNRDFKTAALGAALTLSAAAAGYTSAFLINYYRPVAASDKG